MKETHCGFSQLFCWTCQVFKGKAMLSSSEQPQLPSFHWLTQFCQIKCHNFALLPTAHIGQNQNHPGKTITIYDLLGIVAIAYPLAATPLNIQAGFQVTPFLCLRSPLFRTQPFQAPAPTQHFQAPAPTKHFQASAPTLPGPSTNLALPGTSTNPALPGPSTNLALPGTSTNSVLPGPNPALPITITLPLPSNASSTH